jgi:D-xylose transport system permease protein
MTSREKSGPGTSGPTDPPTDPHGARPVQTSAAERAAPASSRAADFGIDTTTKTTGEAIRAYVQNLRNGELGSLPALLGLAALFVLFTALDTGGTFPSLINIANLLQQGAGQTVIAMGLVFVLLIGEIDLAAGTASGLTAAVLALHFARDGNLLGGMGTTVFAAFVVLMALAVGLAAWLRIWIGAASRRTPGSRCCSPSAWAPSSARSPASSSPSSACRPSSSRWRCSSPGRA